MLLLIHALQLALLLRWARISDRIKSFIIVKGSSTSFSTQYVDGSVSILVPAIPLLFDGIGSRSVTHLSKTGSYLSIISVPSYELAEILGG